VALIAWSQFFSPVVPAQIPLFPQSHTERYKFDALLHLPGISPYFDAIGSGLDHPAPRHCELTAALYLVRHAAIYANDDDYEQYTYDTLSGKGRQGWKGPLSFFDKWENPINDPDNKPEQIVLQGVKDSKKVGNHLLSRYPKLVSTTKMIYADKKARTKDTAVAFAQVFPQKVEVEEILLNRSSFHAQDPHKAYKAFSKEPGNDGQGQFMLKYIAPIIKRFQKHSPVDLEETDIIGLQKLCGYESAVTGKKSKICDGFYRQ
jgi:hypothetical protein